MDCCNVFESEIGRDVFGETLRPGGIQLTERALELCSLNENDHVLDLGCGRGATLRYLKDSRNINGVGIDSSRKLIDIAKSTAGSEVNFYHCSGNRMPFANKVFQCVFAECTLSLMDDISDVIEEVNRVVAPGGYFVITDVYGKNPDAIPTLYQYRINTCIRRLHNLGDLQKIIEKRGFHIELLEDHSPLLHQLFVKIVFQYGSAGRFWNLTSCNQVDGYEFQEAIGNCKPGYFLLVAKKCID